MLLCSGYEEETSPHAQGLALMLSKEARKAFIGSESHGSRIIKTETGITMNVIQCYALTNDSDDDDKTQFYKRLKSVSKVLRKVLDHRDGIPKRQSQNGQHRV
ncbi:unnamed protein product [Schistosoma curassoni]|uniref:Peptidase_M4_C domain-containing protein n=1 Tax=Schistosoma curassoni TaxID=6186 RepID=A0A183KVA0_9TREM|nr:unnamed protein product [Schistosoma curassoni]